MNLGLPKRMLTLTGEDELILIQRLVTTSKEFSYYGAAAAKRNGKSAVADFNRRSRECSDHLRYWRRILRKRHELSFSEGLYRTSRKSIYGYDGAFGMRYNGTIKKGTLLVWVERNELGHNYFMMPSNELICVRGTALDGVAPVKREE